MMIETVIAGGAALIGTYLVGHATWPFVRPRIMGLIGEVKVRSSLRKFRSKETLQANDILIPSERGSTQIDHLLVTRHGIFVIETKNYSGVIHGTEFSKQWTQEFKNGRGKVKQFYNPIMQNKGHIRALQNILKDHPDIPYHSLVVFSDKCVTPALPGVVQMRYLKLAIESRCKNNPVLSTEQVQEISKAIKNNIISGRSARDQHVLKAQLSAQVVKNYDKEGLALFRQEITDNAVRLSFGEERKTPQIPEEHIRLTDAGAKLYINGKTSSIDDFFESAKRNDDGSPVPHGGNFDYFICPYTNDKFPVSEAMNFYQGLWVAYLKKNPDLIQYMNANGTDNLGNSFRCNKVLKSYMDNPKEFISNARNNPWYQNIVAKRKPNLNTQVDQAKNKQQLSSRDFQYKTQTQQFSR